MFEKNLFSALPFFLAFLLATTLLTGCAGADDDWDLNVPSQNVAQKSTSEETGAPGTGETVDVGRTFEEARPSSTSDAVSVYFE